MLDYNEYGTGLSFGNEEWWKNLIRLIINDDLIQENQVTLAKAGTGVGKTVLIPKIALHAFDYQGKVLTTIPKRLITRSNAEYAAKCLDTKVGEYVGRVGKRVGLFDGLGVGLFDGLDVGFRPQTSYLSYILYFNNDYDTTTIRLW